MTQLNRLLICGASPDNGNRNVVLRTYVAEGFRQLIGVDNVYNTPLEYAADHVPSFRPAFVLCFGSCMPDDADYGALRRECDLLGIPLVFWLHDDPYEFDYNYKLEGVADVIFSNDRWCAEHYNHAAAFHLPLAACRLAHWQPIDAQKKKINIFFCGVAFKNRVRLLRDLAPTLRAHDATVLGDGWPGELSFCENRRLPNESLSTAYSEAWITLNIGRDFHYANDRFKLDPSTPGPRTFEAAMAGTTQAFFVESLEIADYYEPGREILLYNSGTEFKRLVERMMNEQEQCIQIAAAAQSRTLQDHTYLHRAQAIVRTLNALNT